MELDSSGLSRGGNTEITQEAAGNRQRNDKIQPFSLQDAVELLRIRFSSVRVQASVDESGTALSVEFLGNGANLEERRLLVSNLAHFLPPTFSIIGVKPEQEGKDVGSS